MFYQYCVVDWEARRLSGGVGAALVNVVNVEYIFYTCDGHLLFVSPESTTKTTTHLRVRPMDRPTEGLRRQGSASWPGNRRPGAVWPVNRALF